jgi:diaminopimelate epimerase
MQINFYKYQGTGNDFVILDNRTGAYSSLTRQQVHAICKRRFGVGADGLMMLNAHAAFDFEMKYFNADGGESSMCGNGGRCLVKFAFDRGIIKTQYRFLAVDGPHEASVDLDGLVSLKMMDVSGMQQQSGNYVLNTGSPHFVQFSNNVMAEDVFKRGREIRNSPQFAAEGINVNFVEQADDSYRIKVRTYERGVEDETFSCGTGVTAAALVCFHNDNGFNRVEIDTLGGRLSVDYDKVGDSFQNIWLTGPAEQVFEGSIQL